VRDLFEPQRASEVPLSGFDINQFFPPDLDVWNRVELLERLGGDKNILSHLKALFDSTTPDRMLALRQASVRRDWDAMEKVSHELKGVAQNLVMPSFLEALKDLRSAIAEHASENTIARKVAFVGEAFEKARKEKV
jgi:HPt (histidine-containing phosphotransfer) domain-containing protein